MVELSTCPKKSHHLTDQSYLKEETSQESILCKSPPKDRDSHPQKNVPSKSDHIKYMMYSEVTRVSMAERRSSPGRRTVAWASWKLPETSGCRKLLASSARPPALFPASCYACYAELQASCIATVESSYHTIRSCCF